MANLDEIQERIEALYDVSSEPARKIPLELQVRQYSNFARDYIAAAGVLDREGPTHWMPVMQLTGHAVELALKACLTASQLSPPRGTNRHNIIELFRKAQTNGFQLDDPSVAAIVHLHHHYFQDLGSGTRFKSRNPAEKTERTGGAVPNQYHLLKHRRFAA